MLATSFKITSLDSKSQVTDMNFTKENHYLQSYDPSQSSSQINESSECFKKVSLAKQNKDGANASRTARITLMSMILSSSRKEVTEILRQLKEDTQIKKLMLNIGQKQFKTRFLFKRQFKQFFIDVFQKVSLVEVESFMRKNKRSQLEYNQRLQLSYNFILKYKTEFEQKFQKTRVLLPIPLKHEEYLRYFERKNSENATH